MYRSKQFIWISNSTLFLFENLLSRTKIANLYGSKYKKDLTLTHNMYSFILTKVQTFRQCHQCPYCKRNPLFHTVKIILSTSVFSTFTIISNFKLHLVFNTICFPLFSLLIFSKLGFKITIGLSWLVTYVQGHVTFKYF